MPGPTFPKDFLLKGTEHRVDGVMETIRMNKRPRSALRSSDANSNGGEAANKGQMLMKEEKKKRKKRSKTSLSSSDAAQEHNKTMQDGRALSALLNGNLRSGSCSGEAVELTLQKAPHECWPQHEDLETPIIAKATVNLKIPDKKRKRIEQELQKVVSTSATIVATKETRREDDRVWKYVCRRAVLVDPKGHIRTSFSAIESSSSGQPNVGNKKTIVSEVSAADKSIVVTITKEGVVAQEWILRQQGMVFGLDAEWRPSYTKGSEHKVALLQICGESECLIIQMLFLDVIPWALVDFLKDPKVLFPGVGVKGDAKKLWKDWGLECNGAVDLISLAVEALSQPKLKHVGLKALANVVIGYEMAKPKRVTMSNWAKPVLDKMQVEYATLDAWVSYAIHQRLVNPPLETGKSEALSPKPL